MVHPRIADGSSEEKKERKKKKRYQDFSFYANLFCNTSVISSLLHHLEFLRRRIKAAGERGEQCVNVE